LASTEYLRRLHDDVLSWYRTADAKAQLILTLDGIFITIVSANIFVKPDELQARKESFGPVAWSLLGLAAAAMVCSIASAVVCLHSRLKDADPRRIKTNLGIDPTQEETYIPAIAWWFGFLATLPRDKVSKYLSTVDDRLEQQILAVEVVALSVNVLRKHRWVNRGWIFAASSLASIVLAGAAYVVTV
jgi:hypothetical protein